MMEYFESLEVVVKNDVGEVVDYKMIEPPTVTGMALYLGFADKNSLYDYRDRSPEFFHSIKKGLSIVEHFHEKNAGTKNSIGAMFVLKCAYGWCEKQAVDITSNGDNITPSTIQIEFIGKDYKSEE